jgi:hypothetical protein
MHISSSRPISSFRVSPFYPCHVSQTEKCLPDPSEYPDHHIFYAFSTSEAPPYIGQVIEDVSSGKSRPIKKTFEDLLFAIHKASREDDDGEAEAEAYEAYDDDYNEFGASRFSHSTLRTQKLQQ